MLLSPRLERHLIRNYKFGTFRFPSITEKLQSSAVVEHVFQMDK